MVCSIIFVNWNSGSQLKESIESIALHHQFLVESVIIVDNNSSDDSLAQVESIMDLPFNLQVIRNSENTGFAMACNQGAALASSKYLLFLNPDTLLFDNSLIVPLSYLQQYENADVGIVGVQLLDEMGHVSRSCYRFPDLGHFVAQATGLNKIPGLKHLGLHMQEWDHLVSREVDQVIGAFFLVRRALFKSLNGFDERFFVYFEEVDFSFRAREKGWKSFYCTEAKAFHAGGGTTHNIKATRLFYSLRSRLLYGFKHFSLFEAWVLVGVTLLIEPITRIVLCMMRGDGRCVLEVLQGYRNLVINWFFQGLKRGLTQ